MKKIVWTMLLISIPMTGFSQNTWEKKEVKETKEETKVVEVAKPNPNEKYLRGAVPMENGKVVFRETIEAPGKTAFQIYNIIGQFMQDETREENQLNSNFVKADTTDYELGAGYEEWLVFQSNAISLDRTRLYYVLRAKCYNGKAEIEMSHIRYLYEEERNPQRYKAEEWITDEEAVNKKNTKLLPITGKFRRKTIDRKDYLFGKLKELLK